MASDDDTLQDLINQLSALRVREAYLVQRIEQRQASNATTERRVTATATPPVRRVGGFAIGDSVRFQGTPVTRGGTGTVVGFTGGDSPFLRIKPSAPNRAVVNRKPHRVSRP